MGAVAGVDDDRLCHVRRVNSSPFNGMAHNDGVAAHGLHGEDGVPQALALYHAGSGSRNVDYVRPQIFARQFKRSTGPGTGLVEQVDDRFAPKGRYFFDVAFHNLFHFRSCLQNQVDFLDAEALQVKDVPARQGHSRFCHCSSSCLMLENPPAFCFVSRLCQRRT